MIRETNRYIDRRRRKVRFPPQVPGEIRASEDSFLSIIQSTLAEFEYQGLNVIGIVQELYRRGSVASKTKDAIQSDISSMILLFLSRGNNVDKVLLRTNEVGKVRINNLKTIYKLANNVGRGGNTVITLSRIAAVFHVVTLKLLSTAEQISLGQCLYPGLTLERISQDKCKQ